MKFLEIKTSDWEHRKVIKIGTLKQLIEYIAELGKEVILRPNISREFKGKWMLGIYDDYRE